MCVCVCVCVCFGSISSLIHISLNIIDIFCLHISFLLNLSNCCIDLMVFGANMEDKSSIISCFPSTFCPTLNHHQGIMYYKSDVTFVCPVLLCKKSVCTVVLCSVYISKLFQ